MIMALWTVRAERNGNREHLALDSSLVMVGWNEAPKLSAAMAA